MGSKDHPTFKAKEACQHLVTQPCRSDTGAYLALGRLVKKKHLKKLDLGKLRAKSDVKHIEGTEEKVERAAQSAN